MIFETRNYEILDGPYHPTREDLYREYSEYRRYRKSPELRVANPFYAPHMQEHMERIQAMRGKCSFLLVMLQGGALAIVVLLVISFIWRSTSILPWTLTTAILLIICLPFIRRSQGKMETEIIETRDSLLALSRLFIDPSSVFQTSIDLYSREHDQEAWDVSEKMLDLNHLGDEINGNRNRLDEIRRSVSVSDKGEEEIKALEEEFKDLSAQRSKLSKEVANMLDPS